MLSFSSLLTDTRNFIRNNFTFIIVTLISVAVIRQLLTYLFYPDINEIEPLKQLIEQIAQKYGDQLTFQNIYETFCTIPKETQQQLAIYMMNYLFKMGIVVFIASLLSMTVIMTLLYTISRQEFSLHNLLQTSIKIVPKVIQFILLAIAVFAILLLFFSLIPPLIFPLLLLSFIGYFLIYMIFLVVMINQLDCYTFINTLKTAFAFLKRETSLIAAIMAIWFIAAFLMNILAGMLASSIIMMLIIQLLKLFLTLAVLCYLYRLYSLSNKVLPYDARH